MRFHPVSEATGRLGDLGDPRSTRLEFSTATVPLRHRWETAFWKVCEGPDDNASALSFLALIIATFRDD